MRDDRYYELARAFDLLPHVVGASWATVRFRLEGNKKPTREEFRKSAAQYLKMLTPLYESYGDADELGAASAYVTGRLDSEVDRILDGSNHEIEKRYDRYVDYG